MGRSSGTDSVIYGVMGMLSGLPWWGALKPRTRKRIVSSVSGAISLILLLLGGGLLFGSGEAPGLALLSAVAWALAYAFAIAAEGRESTGEAAARARLQLAEERLIHDLATPPGPGLGTADDEERDSSRPGLEETEARRPGSVLPPLPEDRLALSALWDVTHSRLDLYHQIATRQAKQSFLAAQVASVAGFVLLVVFAVLAARARNIAGAVSAGGLGAVAAGLAGYIGRTFVRSQESAAGHLRAYFDQPLEFSMFLAAERLMLGAGKDLDKGQRAAILSAMVQSMTAPDARLSTEVNRHETR